MLEHKQSSVSVSFVRCNGTVNNQKSFIRGRIYNRPIYIIGAFEHNSGSYGTSTLVGVIETDKGLRLVQQLHNFTRYQYAEVLPLALLRQQRDRYLDAVRQNNTVWSNRQEGSAERLNTLISINQVLQRLQQDLYEGQFKVGQHE